MCALDISLSGAGWLWGGGVRGNTRSLFILVVAERQLLLLAAALCEDAHVARGRLLGLDTHVVV